MSKIVLSGSFLIVLIGVLALILSSTALSSDPYGCYRFEVTTTEADLSPLYPERNAYVYRYNYETAQAEVETWFDAPGTTRVWHTFVSDNRYVELGSADPVNVVNYALIDLVNGDENLVESSASTSIRRVEGTPCRGMTDGRVNIDDKAALAAVYRTADGFEVWSINPETGVGTFAFMVSRADIEAALAAGETRLIAGDQNPAFYVLSSGECQINYFSLDGHSRENIFACF